MISQATGMSHPYTETSVQTETDYALLLLSQRVGILHSYRYKQLRVLSGHDGCAVRASQRV